MIPNFDCIRSDIISFPLSAGADVLRAWGDSSTSASDMYPISRLASVLEEILYFGLFFCNLRTLDAYFL